MRVGLGVIFLWSVVVALGALFFSVNEAKLKRASESPELVANSSSTSLHRHVGSANVNKTTSVGQVAALLSSRPRSAGNRDGNKNNRDKQLTSSDSKLEPVRVDSKTGKKIAKTQTKRQIFDGGSLLQTGPLSQPPNATTGSRRNEDPWFLDQTSYPLQPYRFAYNVKGRNGQTEQYRQEVGDGKFLTGSYGYVLPDGIYRHVDYVADDRGFRAFIRTSEPGTANQNPADVVMNANPLVVAPGVTYATGLDATLNNPTFPSTTLPQTPSFPVQSQFANSNLSRGPLDYSRDSTTSGDQLPRRAPGSIVGTPARNFSSFSYGPTPSPLNGLDLPVTPDSLDSIRRGGLQPTFGPSGSTFDLKLGTNNNNNNVRADSWQTQPQVDPANEQFGNRIKSSQIQQPVSSPGLPQHLSSSADVDGADKTSRYGKVGQLVGPQWSPAGSLYGPLQPSRFSEPTRRPSLNVYAPSSRFGSGILSYDRPFSVARDANGPNNKLDYDNKHLVHPDSPYLSLERARNIAHLEQLNAVSRGAFSNIRAPLFPTHLGTLAPTNPVVGGPTSSLSTLGQARLIAGGGSSEHHRHEEHHSSKHIVDDLNKISLSKEHRSGSSSGSGREFNFNSQPAHTSHEKDARPPPPQPHFQLDHNRDRDTTGAYTLADGVKGHSARLQAPYDGFQHHQQQQQQQQHQEELGGQLTMQHFLDRPSPGQVKGGGLGGSLPNQQFENVDLEPSKARTLSPPPIQPATSPLPPNPPKEPLAPREPSAPATTTSSPSAISSNLEHDSYGSKTSTKDDTEQDTSSTKSAPLSRATKGTANKQHQQQPHHQVRSVRTSQDNFRTNMLMNDLRTMQQAIGLPQPPRLQRSSLFEDQKLSSSTTGYNLADQMVSSRMKRVEALLSTTTARQQSSPSGPDQPRSISSAGQASVQQAVAVSAIGSQTEPSLGLQQEKRSKKQENDKQEPQSRRLSTGPIQRSLEAEQPFGSLAENQIKTDDSFEAQRLVTQRARLQAEKVSELEKFQQRLRAQQLLSEQIKQQQQQQQPGISKQATASGTPQTSNFSTSSKQRSQSEAHSLAELNSQVKYDDQPETKLHLQHQTEFNQRDNPSRQNDLRETSAHTDANNKTIGESLIKQQVAFNENNNSSELVKQIRSWPSVGSAAETTKSKQRDHLTSGDQFINSIDTSHALDRSNVLVSKHKREESSASLEVSNKSKDQTAQQQSKDKHKGRQQQQQQAARTPANTINLDFINSVTALSVDHLNPFAISSVNPAIQRTEAANSARLSPHKLAVPTLTGSDQAQTLPAAIGEGTFATSAARYATSPELLAMLSRQDRFIEAQGEPRSGSSSTGPIGDRSTGGSLLPSNHRSAVAPYTLADRHQNSAPSPLSASSPTGNLVARFLGGPTSFMSEAANSQHKSFALPGEEAKQMDVSGNKTTTSMTSNLIGENNNLNKRQQEQSNKSKKSKQSAWSTSTSTTRDGFDVRDRSIQVDNHRFFEVVSNLRQPDENSATFQAFKDVDQCEMVLESCCLAHHRNRNRDSGKQFARSGAACMDVELSKEVTVATESFNDCCMSCSLGILAAKSPQQNESSSAAASTQQSLANRCKLISPLASSLSGQLYEHTYVECCQENLPRLSSTLLEQGSQIDCNQANGCSQRCLQAGSLDATTRQLVQQDRCDCFSGYQLASDGVSCVDIDECKLNLHTCHKSEVCDNTRGSFRCLARSLN